MIPLYDKNVRRYGPPYMVLLVIFVNILVFSLALFSLYPQDLEAEYGIVPGDVLSFSAEGLFQLVTSMFLHTSIWYLLINMWFLWLFGDNLEGNLGRIRFLIFYFVAGIIAALIHAYTVQTSELNTPFFGAAGAISGVLGGFLIIFPNNKIKAFFPLLYRPLFFDVPAFIYLPVWLFLQFVFVRVLSFVAYADIIAGFVAGVILALLLKREIVHRDYFVDQKNNLVSFRRMDWRS